MQTMIAPTIIFSKSKMSIQDLMPTTPMIKTNKKTIPEELGIGTLWRSLFFGLPKIRQVKINLRQMFVDKKPITNINKVRNVINDNLNKVFNFFQIQALIKNLFYEFLIKKYL